ncbi:MAG: tetratricopeptide repeat protein [Pseudomonadota bacterium]
MKELRKTSYPIKISTIAAALLTSACAGFDMRQGMIDSDMADMSLSQDYNQNDKYAHQDAIQQDPLSEASQYDKKDIRIYLADAARIAEDEGAFSEAAGHWHKILEKHPNREEALYGLSRTGRKAGLGKPVLSALFKAIGNDPNNSGLIAETAKVYYSIGEYKNAMAQIEQAIKINDEKWEYYSLGGAISDKMNFFTDAASFYERALALSPNNPKVLHNYATSRLMNGDMRSAEQYAYDAAQSEGATIRNYQAYAEILGKQGRFEDAKSFLDNKLDRREAKLVYDMVKAETASPVLWGRSQ